MIWQPQWRLTTTDVADFTKRNGTGGESIYGGTFADEDLSMPVDKEGYVDFRLSSDLTL